MTKMTNKNKSLKTKYGIYLFFLIPLVCYLGYGTYNNIRLKKYGKCTNAVVDYRVRGFRNVSTYYYFFVDEKKYTGESTAVEDTKYISKSHIKGEDVFVTGDTIVVIYLQTNPTINGSNSSVGKDCNCGE